MKKILTVLLLAAATSIGNAQDNGVPQSFKPAKAEDYAQYNKNVLQCIDWLMATPYDPASPQQQAAGAFLMQWIAGSPDVKLQLAPGIINFVGETPTLLMIFMSGWTKYTLESKKPEDKLNGNLKGLESVISYYEHNKEKLAENKQVEAYADMQKKKTLKAYVEKNI
ncbi:hypothetical protein [Taibaiella koreensis]|uniref:hypothetical protein n=1 Tax=Taibaiella koreensis TaxID=1268548 RepID=UPI000E59B21C|nr:hypothetical protein [Taibaiella koreensis]